MPRPFVKPAAQVCAIDLSRGLATVRDSELCVRLRPYGDSGPEVSSA